MENADVSDQNHLVGRLMAQWSKQGIQIPPGATIQQIEAFESKYELRMPPDLRGYFMAVNGMEEWMTDENMFSFKPIDSIKSIPEELAHFGGIPDYRDIIRTLADSQRWFVIVDYLITSAVYAIRLSAGIESTPVCWVGSGTCHRVVAPSFSSFLEVYLANPKELL